MNTASAEKTTMNKREKKKPGVGINDNVVGFDENEYQYEAASE